MESPDQYQPVDSLSIQMFVTLFLTGLFNILCRTHDIFHLSDLSGVSMIRNCQERGVHPHEEPADGSPIYEHCSHVLINENLKFGVVGLRKS